MTFSTANKRLLILIMLGIGIGLAIPLIYHHVKGGTPLGLGIIGESIGFPIVFAIVSSVIECCIRAKDIQAEIIIDNIGIQTAPEMIITSAASQPKAKPLAKPKIVMHKGTGYIDIQYDEDIQPPRSGSLPISNTPRTTPYRDDAVLLLSPTMTLATLGEDDEIFSSYPKNQSTRMPFL